nr:cross-pathway control protein 1 [Quercus suber]
MAAASCIAPKNRTSIWQWAIGVVQHGPTCSFRALGLSRQTRRIGRRFTGALHLRILAPTSRGRIPPSMGAVIDPESAISPTLNTFRIHLHHLSESPQGTHLRDRRHDHSPVTLPPPSTTASQQQTWLSPPAPAGRTPQPVFTQDFDLFQSPPAPLQATPRRAPSLDSTLQPSFNAALSPASHHANDISHSALTAISTQRPIQRPTRPPVPLFHSNPTISFAPQGSHQPSRHVTDHSTFTMGGGGTSPSTTSSITSPLTSASEINVAYEGTLGDLSAVGDAMLFDVGTNDFAFDQLMDYNTDGFTAINSGVSGPTVSPKDVFNSDSVPPSTSFTNLTTPGSTFLETPDDEYQTSPLFGSLVADHNGSDNWFPLFEQDNSATTDGAAMMRTTSSSSVNQIVVHPGGESRKRSTTLASPATYSPTARHSSVAGVGARKRDKPLPAIVVDESDAVALKRARNTAAARKSRAKKVEEREVLEAEINDLKQQVEHWKALALARSITKIEEDD